MIFFPQGFKNEKQKTKFLNMTEWRNWFIHLQSLCLVTFKWKNLPKTVDPYLIEWSLLNYGNVGFIDIEPFGIVSLPTNVGGKLNLYGYPTECFAFGFDGLNRKFIPYIPYSNNFEECNGIVCYDNSLRYPYINYVFDYASRLSDTIRSIDVAVKKLKMPYYIVCDEKQVQSIKKSLEDVNTNFDGIFHSNTLAPDTIQVLNTGANPNLITSMWDNFENSFDVFKGICGLNNNAQSDKKERLLVDEVNANNEVTAMAIENRLQQRQTFCEFINKKWGLNVSVSINENAESLENFTDEWSNEKTGKGVENNE